jgi:hypothetical protein
VPSGSYASRVVHYTLTEYTNYDVRGSDLPAEVQSAQTELITERWVQLDAAGNQLRFKTTTKLPSGVLWQERLFQDGTETVNWYRYPGSGARCSQTSPHSEAPGSSLPLATDAQLAAAGFHESNRPGDLAYAAEPGAARSFDKGEPRSPAPQFAAGRSVIIRDDRSEQRVEDLFFGVRDDGSEVLLQSTKFSAITDEPGSLEQVFSIESLPAGCGRPG